MSRSRAMDLLAELRQREIELAVEEGWLLFRPVEAVGPELRGRIARLKPELMELLVPPTLVVKFGRGDRPDVDSCSRCAELDFVRPRAGGAWRCARCLPRELPDAAIEWWPRVTAETPFVSWMLASAE